MIKIQMMSSIKDQSSLEEKDDGEDSPLHDEIFDILFPASPAEETEDKDDSHVELGDYEFGLENKEDIKQKNNTQSTNEKTKVTDKKNVCYNSESSKNESEDQSQSNSNTSGGKCKENENETLKASDAISNSKDKLSINNYYHSSNNNLEESLPVKEMEPVLPIDDELFFDFSDTNFSDDENEKSFNKSNVSVSDFLVLDEVDDRKQSFQYSKKGMMLENEKDTKIEMKNKSEYLDKGKAKMNISKDSTRGDIFRARGERSKNIAKTFNTKTSKIIEKKGLEYVQIEKEPHKKNDELEDVSDKEEAIELEPQSSDILDDISDDEMLDNSDTKKKNNYVLQDVKNDRVQKRDWTNEDSKKKVRLRQPAMKMDEPLQNKYDEIIIIGDERLPTLTNYKNVKILRVEGLELRNLKSFIKSSGLHDDISSKPLLKRMIVLCVGLNDIILKSVTRKCFDMKKTGDKSHKPCYLFRYTSVRYDLLSHINSQVEEISKLLPASCDVIFYNLYLFDLDMINENLSLDHFRKYGHHAALSESDIHNNKIVHNMIKDVNGRIARESALLDSINCTNKYQERFNVNFMPEAKKIMVFNIKKIQKAHSKPHGDESSLRDNNIDKEDLRWVLNRMNKREVHSLKDELQSGPIRNLQTDKKSANHKKISEKKVSTSDPMEGHSRKGWHSPGRCSSPTGWHPADICRQAEQERRELHMERKNMKNINEKLMLISCELNQEEKSRNSSRIEREKRVLYERKENSKEKEIRRIRLKQAKEKMERSSRTSRSLERSMPRNNEGRSSERSMPRNKEVRSSERSMTRNNEVRSSEKIMPRNNEGRTSERSMPRNNEVRSSERIMPRNNEVRISERIMPRNNKGRSSERSVPRNNEGSIKRRNSQNYEVLKKESPTFLDRRSQKLRSSSKTIVQEYDSATSEALRNLAEVHDRSCQMYIDNPNAHPDYNKEYYVFYDAKSQKIREIGGDPLDYDFLPEWKYVWEIRSQEIFREAWLNMKNQCINMMEEKKMAQEKKNTHRKKVVQEDHSNFSKSSKRKRCSERRESDHNSSRKLNEKCNSAPIEKRQKYEKEELLKNEGNLNDMTDRLQLEALIDEELKGINKSNSTIETKGSSKDSRILNERLQASQETTFDSRSLKLPSTFHEENDMDNLGLEEVGESVMPFNLGKYIPESKKYEDEPTIKTSDCSENVLEILMMLSKLGDKMGSLGIPIKILFDKANEEKMKNRSTINIFTDPDMSLVMQLISNKLIIAIENESNSAIENVIYQEVKNRVDELLKVVEETFVEGLNVQHIAKKSLGMKSSEILKCIKSGLEISTSSSISEAKLMKIYTAIKEKQFKYVESHSNINSSGSSERVFPMQTAKTNVNKMYVSQTEIPFNLPTRKKSNNTEKYDPFEEDYL